jgi:two-component system NarL family sensor kinase
VIAAQETERRRLAGDIHDGISQRLVTLDEARAAIGGLRPPVLDDLGLAGGLASLARSVPQVEVDLDLADERIPEHVEIALYRIAQEGLQNIVKHARASTARLRFAVQRDAARLEVTDDGVGFDATAAGDRPTGYGMQSMLERAELVGGPSR